MTDTTGTYPSVSCPSCRAEFPIDPEKIPAGGIHARCSSCGHIFLVEDDLATPPVVETQVPEITELETAETEVREVAEPEEESPHLVEAAEAPPTELPELPAVGEGPPELEPPAAPLEEESPELEQPAAPVGEGPEDVEPSGVAAADRPGTQPSEEDREGPDPGSTAAAALARFGQQDPHERARRIARVLVSDMMTYNPQLYDQAIERGTLAEDFDEEVKRSWEEYVERVGAELANATTYFQDALNEILARGEEVF